MRLGLIVESGPEGAEAQVLPFLAGQIVPGIVVEPPVTFRKKPDMIANCGPAVNNLLNVGCDEVLIVWDLYPAMRDDGCRPDCVEDCRSIREKLRAAGIADDDGRVTLICIREELEAWFVADGRALSAVLSRPTHRVRVRDTKRPDSLTHPKTRLRRLFGKHGYRDYSDRIHAIQIARAMPDRSRIARSQSFRRFATTIQP